jgi:Carboxypeptidase regulatory-like domain/Peptidase family M1 domain
MFMPEEYMNHRKSLVVLLVTLLLIAAPTFVTHGAGGRIEGKITDPKGAAIVGATITITESATSQSFSAVTDDQGHYKIEGLPPGNYSLVVSAKGFGESHREVKVGDGAVIPLDLRLEIAAVEENVTIQGGGPKPNSDPVYQQLRQQAKSEQDFSGPFATVNNLTVTKDAATFTLHSGEIYFVAPIEGRVTGAVFIGDGELNLEPPTTAEKHGLALFIDEEKLAEPFTHLVLRFTDKTFDEIKSSGNVTMGVGGPQAGKARELYHENQQLMRRELRDNGELRTLIDLYAPRRVGYFNAFIGGKRHNKLVFLLDPLGIPAVSPEEVALLSYGETDRGIWTAFHRADEYTRHVASSSENHHLVDLLQHEIDGTIKGAHITASDVITFRSMTSTRVVPLNLYRTLRVSRVQDEAGKDLAFVQEGKEEDADFGVIWPQPLETGKTYKVTVQYDGGDALRDSGSGNFILVPRLTWYPNNSGSQFGDRAIFDMTFHYPKGNILVGTGAPVGVETREGDQIVSKWSSGTTELAVAGFNYGRFKKKEVADAQSGYNIEFYANEDLPDDLKQIQANMEQIESKNPERGRAVTGTTLGALSTTGMAGTAIADAENSTRIYNAYFGKLPYTRIAMTQQPAANFGQAWPTLIFMPYLAFVDSTLRTQLIGTRGGTDNFWRYVAPHEISHQWWGHVIGWDSYRDQWMSEGFAEFSASLYVQAVRGNDKFVEFWEEQRKRITQASPATRDRKPYTVGPVTQGFRLSNAKTGGVYQFLVYPKGAYILHMIRMMMYNQADGGDRPFKEMMKDFVQTHFNKDVSTEDFKRAVEKHMTPELNLNGDLSMDWFFNEWVYGTEMPSYRFEYQLSNGGTVLNGHITQSGVSDNFKMLVPLYVDYGKGWMKLGAAKMSGNTTVELKDVKLPQAAKRAAVCSLNDVLAASIENGK